MKKKIAKIPKEREPTTIRFPKEWKTLIKEYQDNSDGISNSSRTMSAYIIKAVQAKMVEDNII